jgi:hypothetical protein
METNMANPGDDNSVQEIAPHVNGERSSRCKYELVHCLDGPFMFQMNTKNKWSSDITTSRPSQQDPTATEYNHTTLLPQTCRLSRCWYHPITATHARIQQQE